MAKNQSHNEESYLSASENCPFECEGKCNGEKLDDLCEGNV
jgi:hypothetical protein